MTRTEFIENITTWWELKDFCSDADCYVCEDIVDDDTYDEWVDEDVSSAVEEYGWRDILSFLRDLPTGWEYYRRNSSFDYDGVDDDDFEDYKQQVLDWGDEYAMWDDDEEDEEDDFVGEPTAEAEEANDAGETWGATEEFTVGDLIDMCGAALISISQNDKAGQREENEAFIRLLTLDGRQMPI